MRWPDATAATDYLHTRFKPPGCRLLKFIGAANAIELHA
jgi:hypothetical protein